MSRSLLGLLVGEWNVKIIMPADPTADISGQAFFEWMGYGHFLSYRSGMSESIFPTTTSIIGGDDTMGSYTMLYYDSRDVSRIYQMSLSEQEWKLWRDDPQFSQRFVGTFNDNGDTITAYWENSTDGSTWERDFDMIYSRTL